MKVLLVEDQKLVLSAMALLLDLEPDIDVVATAENGEQARALIESCQPDIVVTDIEMPEGDGLGLANWIKNSHPNCRVLILTTFAKPGYLQSALRAGVHGYILKDTPAEEIASKLRLIEQGAQVIEPSLTQKAMQFSSPLNTRETTLLKLIAEGYTTRKAAEAMHISHGTARNYLSEAMQKLQVESRQAAIIQSQKLGLL